MPLIYHPPLYLFTTHEDIKKIIKVRDKKLVNNLNSFCFISNSYFSEFNCEAKI